ncbi:MAG: hypothetical protein WCI77_08910 [Candidatus Omnitrophota bacterium]
MEKEVLTKIITILKQAEDFYVPIKKLWKESSVNGKFSSYDDFLYFFKKDHRFEVIETSASYDEDNGPDMEEAGFYTGPRVKLKSRKITKEDMQRIALRHAQNVIDNLIKAYEVKPQDLPHEKEDELIELMKKAKHLKENIDTAFKKDTNRKNKS